MHKLLASNSSELLAVFGRCRVGKTFLIREVYKKQMVFELTGVYGGSHRDQLQIFQAQIEISFPGFEINKVPPNWISAFQVLQGCLNASKSKKKKVIFIDEFPWIVGTRSKFLMAFEHFWNSYCAKRNDLVVVVCGSASSFMRNKIIKNKGGLHSRPFQIIKLLPFNLNEVEQFLESKNIHMNHYDILQLYMAFGGVPQYLNQLVPGESVVQNIDRLCFENNGALLDEFNEVFKSLFKNSEVHEAIVEALSKTKSGVTRKKLLELCQLGSGGVFTKALAELSESGFIAQYTPFGKRKKDSLYRLADEYSLFYLKFIEPMRGQGAGTWAKLFPKQSYKIWAGLAFETICLKHIGQIKKELGIDKIYSLNSGWHNDKAQIVLLIDRDDGIINLCEMMFYNGKFTLDKAGAENLRNKVMQFKESTKTRKNVFVVMLTTFGLSENANSLELVSNSLTMDCLFE